MLGRLSLGNKSSSSPREIINSTSVASLSPYQDATSSSLTFQTTTTHTEVIPTTTTQTTTHFFSRPLFRRRDHQTSARPRTVHGVPSELPLEHSAAQMVPLSLDKELPPIPQQRTYFSPKRRTTPNASHSFEANGARPRTAPLPTSLASHSLTSSASPMTALAHASLGLGLPHVIPAATPPSIPSEVNTIAFTSSSNTTRVEPRRTPPVIRRTKSAHKLMSFASFDRSADLDSNKGTRRSRVESFGASTLPSNGSTPAGKDSQMHETVVAEGKSLSRRSSFWARKKSTASIEIMPMKPSPEREFTLPPLPILSSLAPLSMELTPPTSPSRAQHSRGLSRSYSERLAPRRPSPTVDITPSHKTPLVDNLEKSELKSSLTPDRQHHKADGIVPTRQRAQTNPPMLHRLSFSLFSSQPPPLPDRLLSSGTGTSPPRTESPQPISKRPNHSQIPKPLVGKESPTEFLKRLTLAVGKAEVAAILASSVDGFYVEALQIYLHQFDFVADPLDIAVRKLLMDVGLPRETQQIDRMIEAFAKRYIDCNPGLFISEDHPYILAFSLIMLHTDAFNKSNKRKMTKADYIKNTRLPGVAPEILDCFYDNIVFAPFIFIEDSSDVRGQRGLSYDGRPQSGSMSATSINSTPGGSMPHKSNKIDPYHLIANNLLAPLRVDVDSYIPPVNPYSYLGTGGSWNHDELQQSFAEALVLEIGIPDLNRQPPFFSLNVGNVPPSPRISTIETNTHVSRPTQQEVWSLKVTKAGVVNRKDDVFEKGKKRLSRKWRAWGVVLTGSQLLFFRDPSWANALAETTSEDFIPPHVGTFKPDEIVPVKDAVVVYDNTYFKHRHTLRFANSDGRQFLMQASSEDEMNAWISRINYASAFRTAGVRSRALGMSSKDIQLTGVAAATSHLHDLQQQTHSTHTIRHWDGDAPAHLMSMLSGKSSFEQSQLSASNRTSAHSSFEFVDSGAPEAPEVDGAEQFKATFDGVKADLAANPWLFESADSSRPTHVVHTSPISRLPDRSQIIQNTIQELDDKIASEKTQLESDMRFVRGIATLTPFQRSTRDRLLAAVQNISSHVAQIRLTITKLQCHRDVLSADLKSEDRDWHNAREAALKVAAETLQSRQHSECLRSSTSGRGVDTMPHRRPESSRSDSFHSALDLDPSWLSSDDLASPDFLGVFESPQRSSTDSRASFPFTSFNGDTSQDLSTLSTSTEELPSHTPILSHERYYTAQESTPEEQAEEWNKTRCAQRVSLVRLPSDIGFLDRFEKYGAHLQPSSRER